MNTFANYERQALDAERATDAAKLSKAPEAWSKAADAHFAAGVLAKACGKRDEHKAHVAEGRSSLAAAKGKPLDAIEAGTSEGVRKAWETRHKGYSEMTPTQEHLAEADHYYGISKSSKSAEWKSGLAHESSSTAFKNNAKSDHYWAAKAHMHAAHAQESKGDSELGAYHRKMAGTHAEKAGSLGREINIKASDATDPASLQAIHAERMATDTELQAGIVAGGYSYNDFTQRLRDAVADNAVLSKKPEGNQLCGGGPWVADVIIPAHEQSESWMAIVTGTDGKLYEVLFDFDKDSGVKVTGDPKQVERVSDYDYVTDPTPEKVSAAKAARVAALEAAVTVTTSEFKPLNGLGDKTVTGYARSISGGTYHITDKDSSLFTRQSGDKRYGVHFSKSGTSGWQHVSDHDDMGSAKLASIDHAKTLKASNATGDPALEATRADDTAKNAYKDAAARADGVSSSIKGSHKKAHHLHRIAMECANLCGDSDAAMKHSEAAKKHQAALEACEM